MYQRTVKPAPGKAIVDGKPQYGTYNTPLEDVNLIEAPNPYTREVSLPEKMGRLQQWEAFQMGDKRFFLMTAIAPIFGFSEVMIYDKVNKKEYKMRHMDGPGVAKRSAANILDSEVTHAAADGTYYGIKNTLASDGKISFEFKGAEFAFFFEADFTGREPIVVVMPFSENRPFYSHKCLAPGSGWVEIGGERIAIDDEAFMIVDDHMGYYPHFFWYDWVTCGEYQDGKLVGIQLTTNQLMDPLYNNENCLWYDGKMLPLPNITFYRGRDRTKRWFIKDDFGMVNLTFDPTDYDTGVQQRFETDGKYLDFYAPFGYLNGTVTVEGVTVEFKDVYCMGESKDGQYLLDEANIDN